MPWSKTDGTVSFECDTCDVVIDCDVVAIRETAQPGPTVSDFSMCFNYVKGLGWRSFKRTGRDWSYHCLACGPQAETDHHGYQRQENERDRIKSRNAREGV